MRERLGRVGEPLGDDPEAELAAEGADERDLEQRPAAEVSTLAGRRLAPEAAGVWNPAFDVTPATLITAFITDAGVLRRPFSRSISSALAGRRQLSP